MSIEHRVFIYGLQSSGSSLFAYFLGQEEKKISIVDLWSHCVAPRLRTKKDVVLKATINAEIKLSQHVQTFSPTFKILFVRDPIQNFLSLNIKHYRDWRGVAEEKFRVFDSFFAMKDVMFDTVVYFEDFIGCTGEIAANLTKRGICIPPNAGAFPRTHDDIIRFNSRYSDWCRRNYAKEWGFGNIHFDHLPTLNPEPYMCSTQIRDLVWNLCPNAMRFYEQER